MDNNVKWTIEKQLAVLSENRASKKLLTLCSWNDRPAKLDIRQWRDMDGKTAPGKGVTLNDEEAAELADALNQYLAD